MYFISYNILNCNKTQFYVKYINRLKRFASIERVKYECRRKKTETIHLMHLDMFNNV